MEDEGVYFATVLTLYQKEKTKLIYIHKHAKAWQSVDQIRTQPSNISRVSTNRNLPAPCAAVYSTSQASSPSRPRHLFEGGQEADVQLIA